MNGGILYHKKGNDSSRNLEETKSLHFWTRKRSRSKESVLQEPFVMSVVTWWHVARTFDVEHVGSIEQQLKQ